MQVKAWKNLGEVEVTVDISVEDISDTLAEYFVAVDKDDRNVPNGEVERTLNQCGQFLRALTDEHIARLSPDARELVGTFLAEQAKRDQVSELHNSDAEFLAWIRRYGPKTVKRWEQTFRETTLPA